MTNKKKSKSSSINKVKLILGITAAIIIVVTSVVVTLSIDAANRAEAKRSENFAALNQLGFQNNVMYLSGDYCMNENSFYINRDCDEKELAVYSYEGDLESAKKHVVDTLDSQSWGRIVKGQTDEFGFFAANNSETKGMEKDNTLHAQRSKSKGDGTLQMDMLSVTITKHPETVAMQHIFIAAETAHEIDGYVSMTKERLKSSDADYYIIANVTGSYVGGPCFITCSAHGYTDEVREWY